MIVYEHVTGMMAYADATETMAYEQVTGMMVYADATGMMAYETALRSLARWENPLPTGVDPEVYNRWLDDLIRSKYTYIVASQVTFFLTAVVSFLTALYA